MKYLEFKCEYNGPTKVATVYGCTRKSTFFRKYHWETIDRKVLDNASDAKKWAKTIIEDFATAPSETIYFTSSGAEIVETGW